MATTTVLITITTVVITNEDGRNGEDDRPRADYDRPPGNQLPAIL